MKAKTRILPLLLCIVMILGIVPMQVFADDAKYTVTFDMNHKDGKDVAVEVEEGETVAKQKKPIRFAHTFVKWTVDEAGRIGFDFDTPITEDITLYAQWRVNYAWLGMWNGMIYNGVNRPEEPEEPAHEHTYSEDWSMDAKKHWHAATCGCSVKADEAVHTYGADYNCTVADVCEICGYEKPAGHIWGEWTDTETVKKYTRTCTACDETETKIRTAAIGEEYYETLEDALSAAEEGDTVTLFDADTYTIPCTEAGEWYLEKITVEGAGDGIVLSWTGTNGKTSLIATDVTFKNVAFAESIVLTGSATFEDVTFEKGIDYSKVTGDVTLTDCTVKKTSGGFSMKLLEGTNEDIILTATNTTFEGGVQVEPYEGDTTKGMTVFKNCSFTGTHVWKNTHITSNNPITIDNCTFSEDANHTSNVYLANNMDVENVTVLKGTVLVSAGATSTTRTIYTITK